MAEAGRALHLIYVNDEGKFELGEEAVAALNAVKGPVGVCAVCGRARQVPLHRHSSAHHVLLNILLRYHHTCIPAS